MSSQRPMRADAQKNREALVQVARKHLGQQGVTTSLEAIAREAGVGVGTLYRHFPDRDHLIVEALNAQGAELREAADTIRGSERPANQLEAWLAKVEQYLSSYQGLPDSLAQALSYDEDTPLAITCHEIIDVTDEFLDQAQQLGTAKMKHTGQELFEAVLMVAWLGPQVPAGRRDAIRNMLRYGYRMHEA